MALKVGALWLREATDKEGKPFKYFSGVIQTLNGDAHIVVFRNRNKEKENHPDYLIYRSEPKKEGSPEVDLADDIPF